MTKYLIVNSDDYGISDGVNQGIIEANLKGIVTSTTVMANMPAAVDGIPQAQQKAPKLGLGLHLTLSYGPTVSPPEKVPSLVNADGLMGPTYGDLMNRIGQFTAADLEMELNAQFDRFVEIAGRKPDHIDSHHRAAYMHPVAFDIMTRLANNHNLPLRRAVWADGIDYGDIPTNADGQLIERLREIYEKNNKPRWTDYLDGSIFFWDRRSRIEPMLEALKGLQDGYTEVVCHVGYGEGLDEDYNIQRLDDLAGTLDPAVIQYVTDNDIQLVTFADLPE